MEQKTKCKTTRLTLCDEALKLVHARQAKALTETGSKISIPTAVNKLLLGK